MICTSTARNRFSFSSRVAANLRYRLVVTSNQKLTTWMMICSMARKVPKRTMTILMISAMMMKIYKKRKAKKRLLKSMKISSKPNQTPPKTKQCPHNPSRTLMTKTMRLRRMTVMMNLSKRPKEKQLPKKKKVQTTMNTTARKMSHHHPSKQPLKNNLLRPLWSKTPMTTLMTKKKQTMLRLTSKRKKTVTIATKLAKISWRS